MLNKVIAKLVNICYKQYYYFQRSILWVTYSHFLFDIDDEACIFIGTGLNCCVPIESELNYINFKHCWANTA